MANDITSARCYYIYITICIHIYNMYIFPHISGIDFRVFVRDKRSLGRTLRNNLYVLKKESPCCDFVILVSLSRIVLRVREVNLKRSGRRDFVSSPEGSGYLTVEHRHKVARSGLTPVRNLSDDDHRLS